MAVHQCVVRDWVVDRRRRADRRTEGGDGRAKLLGLLDAGDPRGEVRTAWHAKEVVRSIYEHHDPDLAAAFVDRLGHDLQDGSCPIEVRSLGRTLLRWKEQIAAWHRAHVTNGPTEAANNLIKRIKRVAFGFTRFRNYRIRVLLYAGKPNWDLLATITPRSKSEVPLWRGDEPHRREPVRQRQARPMQDRPRGHRRLAPALHAQPQARARPPRFRGIAVRAHEPVRPPQPGQILGARVIVGEPRPQLLERRRVVHTGNRRLLRRHHI